MPKSPPAPLLLTFSLLAQDLNPLPPLRSRAVLWAYRLSPSLRFLL